MLAKVLVATALEGAYGGGLSPKALGAAVAAAVRAAGDVARGAPPRREEALPMRAVVVPELVADEAVAMASGLAAQRLVGQAVGTHLSTGSKAYRAAREQNSGDRLARSVWSVWRCRQSGK